MRNCIKGVAALERLGTTALGALLRLLSRCHLTISIRMEGLLQRWPRDWVPGRKPGFLTGYEKEASVPSYEHLSAGLFNVLEACQLTSPRVSKSREEPWCLFGPSLTHHTPSFLHSPFEEM